MWAERDGWRARRLFLDGRTTELETAFTATVPKRSRRPFRPVLACALVLACAMLLTLAAAPQADAATPEQAKCTRHSGEFKPGPAIAPAVTLTPDLPTQTVNFAGGRGWQFAEVVLKASRPLPSSFEASQLDVEVLRRFSRQSETLSTITLPPPTFT
jgi:hypothetical protein